MVERQFRDNRRAALVAVNLNTFWFVASIVIVFAAWDRFVDPEHWLAAFRVRLLGTGVIIGTGLLQKLPGKARWLPLLAKVRLVVAVATAMVAALMLDGGYGFSVAGIVAIILTGPYVAIDSRDLLVINACIVAAIGAVMIPSSLNRFDAISTIVFVLLAALVSTLLGRVLEVSNRRAFALELEMHREARTDTLTGLANRRAMQERGPLELKRAQRIEAPASLILCDIDHFKRVNDRFGHEAGDTVLRVVASTLRATLRETDLLGRWGGEEFIVVLVEADVDAAREIAERMRSAVASLAFDAAPEQLTISLGVATVPEVKDIPASWETLLKVADRHLYRAKSEGRNRVVAHA